MEEVPGLGIWIPHLVAYPPVEISSHLSAEEWSSCIEMWQTCIDFRLLLPPDQFAHLTLDHSYSGVSFIQSYLKARDPEQVLTNAPREAVGQIHTRCYLLLRRLLLEISPFGCSQEELFQLLSNGSKVYSSLRDWNHTLQDTWKRNPHEIAAAVQWCRETLITGLAMPQPSKITLSHLHQAISLTRSLPAAGTIFMTGSDYVESMYTCYANLSDDQPGRAIRRALTKHLYDCLRGLMSDDTPKDSLLLDHLYTLRSLADVRHGDDPARSTLLASLVVTTPFMQDLGNHFSVHKDGRSKDLLDWLHKYRTASEHIYPVRISLALRMQQRKGKAPKLDDNHVHKAADVSRVHDLFPELPGGYILRILDYFSNNVENAVTALLEPETLPTELRRQKPEDDWRPVTKNTSSKAANATPLPSRAAAENAIDDDDFDNLRISATNLHMGRRDINVDMTQTKEEHARSKAAILAALAAFDSDDDERDDTYDEADVGGTVDTTLDTDEGARARVLEEQQHEGRLFALWKNNPGAFARDNKTRLSAPRQQLRRETKMTDEQIEGWALMLSRDAGRQEKLEKTYSVAETFTGSQRYIRSSKWRANDSESASEDVDSPQEDSMPPRPSARATQGLGGAHDHGRAGRTTAGPSIEVSDPAARNRKERGRGRGRVRHARREGHARKMARGMAGPGG